MLLLHPELNWEYWEYWEYWERAHPASGTGTMVNTQQDGCLHKHVVSGQSLRQIPTGKGSQPASAAC